MLLRHYFRFVGFSRNELSVSVRHLVGLVHIVVVQRAEEMLQTRHVVVIYGVDDGLHHKGVFLVLNR